MAARAVASSVPRAAARRALGFGLRCGFLGLLHMDVFHQRLSDEFGTAVITTAPMVAYKVVRAACATLARLVYACARGMCACAPQILEDKEAPPLMVEKPADFPPANKIHEVYEPTVIGSVVAPQVCVCARVRVCVMLGAARRSAGARRSG